MIQQGIIRGAITSIITNIFDLRPYSKNLVENMNIKIDDKNPI